MLIRILAALLLATSAHAATITGTFVSVADGDTVTVLDFEKVKHKIRLSGIDAQEKKQPFGWNYLEKTSKQWSISQQ